MTVFRALPLRSTMAPTRLPAPEPSLTFHGSEGTVSCMCFAVTGPLAGRLLSGSTHTFVYVWDLLSTKKLLSKFRCDDLAEKNDTVLSVLPSTKNSAEVAIHIRNGSLHKWILADSTPVRLHQTSPGPQLGFCPAVDLPEARLIALPSGDVAGNSSGIGLIDVETFEPVGFLCPKENSGPPMRIVRYKDEHLFVAYESGDILLWDIRSPSRPIFASSTFRTPSAKSDEDLGTVTPLALDVDVDRNLLIVGGTSNQVRRYEITPGGLDPLDSISLSTSGVSEVKIRPDRKIVTVASWDFTGRVYSWKTLKPLAVLDMHKDTVQCIEYAMVKEQNCVILGGKDGLISVWPLY